MPCLGRQSRLRVLISLNRLPHPARCRTYPQTGRRACKRPPGSLRGDTERPCRAFEEAGVSARKSLVTHLVRDQALVAADVEVGQDLVLQLTHAFLRSARLKLEQKQ